VYTKDFASLLQLLDLSAQSGTLIVECEGETWQAVLPLRDGKLLSCRIVDVPSSRTLLSGDQAIDWLSQRGELRWSLQESSPPPYFPASPSGRFREQSSQRKSAINAMDDAQESSTRAFRLIPLRANTSSGIILDQWPRDILRVFALIDGVRSLAEIAMLLRRPLAELVPIFRELAAKGFITIKEY
jgi:hypothetical protein